MIAKSSENKIMSGGNAMNCTELERIAAEERKAYFKAWRDINKHRTAEHRRRFWEKKALARLNAQADETKKEAAK